MFLNLSVTPDPAAFAVPSSGCVDLRPLHSPLRAADNRGSSAAVEVDDGIVPVNHRQRLAHIDAMAQVGGGAATLEPNRRLCGGADGLQI